MTKGRTPRGVTRDPLRAQKKTLYLLLVVYGPESVLPEVLAIHTIEMIPKSMILVIQWSMYGYIPRRSSKCMPFGQLVPSTKMFYLHVQYSQLCSGLSIIIKV